MARSAARSYQTVAASGITEERYTHTSPVTVMVAATVSCWVVGLLLYAGLAIPAGVAFRLSFFCAAVPWVIVALASLARLLEATRRPSPMPAMPGAGEVIRLLPVRSQPEVRLSGAASGFLENDLTFLVDGLATRGVSWRSWMGTRLPSGKVLNSYDEFQPFPEMLTAAGVLRGRGPRSSGTLETTDAVQIRRRLAGV